MLEKETAIADLQKEIVKADQGVLIAERIADASVKKTTGDANSVRLQANVLIGGSGDNANGGISGLLGLQLLEQLGKKVNKDHDPKTKN